VYWFVFVEPLAGAGFMFVHWSVIHTLLLDSSIDGLAWSGLTGLLSEYFRLQIVAYKYLHQAFVCDV
jgi:hypothetical protein